MTIPEINYRASCAALGLAHSWGSVSPRKHQFQLQFDSRVGRNCSKGIPSVCLSSRRTTASTRSPWGSAWRWWTRLATKGTWPWPSATGPCLSSGILRAEPASPEHRAKTRSPFSPSRSLWRALRGALCCYPHHGHRKDPTEMSRCEALRCGRSLAPSRAQQEQQQPCYRPTVVPRTVLDNWTVFK